ncbi:hypothetical protein CUMW_202270 [Citrus unshiu]|uniref:Uncharacterized protein n=1 Tax=Citrus unshiu TaxID=55188 RepID=A0A2H5Q765_CITUN|nr:hypothetical protein CUMW_202270 [Citrus unshiu]
MLHPNVFSSLVLERIVVKAPFLKKQYSQQESAKLRQQIQMLQNSNRSLSNWRIGLSEASRGSGPRRRLSWQMKACVFDQMYENQSVIAEMERFQQANTAIGQDLNAIHELASWNFFGAAIIEGGGSAYSHPDKKILHLG